MTWGVDVAAAYRRAGDTTNIVATLAAATIFYISPWLILTIISGLVLLVLIILRLDLGLALVAFFAPFFFLPRQLFESAFSMSELILLMCVVSFVLHGAYSVRRNFAQRVSRTAARLRYTFYAPRLVRAGVPGGLSAVGLAGRLQDLRAARISGDHSASRSFIMPSSAPPNSIGARCGASSIF